jgi:hypothetical protein
MRMALAVALFTLAGLGCSSPGATTQALCDYCLDDSQCGGNPCFQDVSGSRFCGAPCGDCPAGFSCQTVMGTTGLAQTCFPDTEACIPQGSAPGGPGAPDLGSGGSDDFGSMPPTHDMGGIPVGGAIGPSGGSVDRLFFGFTGDVRPAQCGGAYPQQIVNNIYTLMKQQDVQFAVDQGDHMFNCGSGSSALSAARAQMQNYVDAASLLGKTVFMTMGNHECTGESQTLCSLLSYGNNPNYTAYMDVLKPIAAKPYYRFDVMTKTGLAVFLIVADDVWDTAEQQWLTQQLTDADAHAKYTFVSKHHPDGNTDHPEFQQIYDLVRAHKYTLFLTGHSHLFKRQQSDPRAMVIGCGGAPLAGGTFYGFGTALQGTDDRIYVSIYDQSTGNVVDQFDVGPQ